MRKYIDSALKILYKIFTDNTYSNVALYDQHIDDMTTRLVYGVLEKNIQIEYILDQLLSKKPKNLVYVLLKIGTYALLYLDNVPSFAIVSECVEVCKMENKKELSGLCNAVLKKVSNKAYKLPSNDLSVKYSKPKWFINKLLSQYGEDKTIEILDSKDNYLEHIRVNSKLVKVEDIEKEFVENKTEYVKSDLNGFYVKVDKCIKDLFNKGFITYQAPSSMTAVNSIGIKDGDLILDLCSAPGGKAVLMSELAPSSKIVACDIHPHRIELIKKYATRMQATNIETKVLDATKFNKDFEGQFDVVLLDAPCSCLGTFNKHPDVFMNKEEKDIKEISDLQKAIIVNAAKYVKSNGTLLYSTCTLFKEENEQVIEYLLKEDNKFKIEKEEQILPHLGYDGFFVCKLIKL